MERRAGASSARLEKLNLSTRTLDFLAVARLGHGFLWRVDLSNIYSRVFSAVASDIT
jgi:hypothetical protein